MNYDVAIVGTGPAGAMAAIELADSGLNIIILEKEELPRHKPCGGLISANILELIDLKEEYFIANKVQSIHYQHNYKDEYIRKLSGKGEVLLVNRNEFDYALLGKAILSGGDFIRVLNKTTVSGVKQLSDKVIISLDNSKKIEVKYLIAADGAFSKIAKSVGLMNNRNFALALDAEIITSDKFYEEHRDTMIMNYFCLPYGYGWIFPKENKKFSCGVGTWGKNINLKKELDKFISQSFPENSIEKMEIYGHPVPLFQGTEQIAKDRVFLTGDAASLVDPVSGEGIRFALLSGKIAAGLIRDELAPEKVKSTGTISERYQSVIGEEMGSYLKERLSFAFLAFKSNPDFFYNSFVKQ